MIPHMRTLCAHAHVCDINTVCCKLTSIGKVPADVPLGAAELNGVHPAVDALQLFVTEVGHNLNDVTLTLNWIPLII